MQSGRQGKSIACFIKDKATNKGKRTDSTSTDNNKKPASYRTGRGLAQQNICQRDQKADSILNLQNKKISVEFAGLAKSDEKLIATVKLLCSLPGIELFTTPITVSETKGFDLITNKQQLTSYAGLDVKEKQSGTLVKGNPKISKRKSSFKKGLASSCIMRRKA